MHPCVIAPGPDRPSTLTVGAPDSTGLDAFSERVCVYLRDGSHRLLDRAMLLVAVEAGATSAVGGVPDGGDDARGGIRGRGALRGARGSAAKRATRGRRPATRGRLRH